MENNERKIMGLAKVGERGQIVIPKDMREMFDINPGDSILLLADIDRGIALLPYSEYMKFAKRVFEEEKKL